MLTSVDNSAIQNKDIMTSKLLFIPILLITLVKLCNDFNTGLTYRPLNVKIKAGAVDVLSPDTRIQFSHFTFDPTDTQSVSYHFHIPCI